MVDLASFFDFGHFFGIERCASESDEEPLAPDANGFVFVEIGSGGDFVILVTDVAFDGTEVDKSAFVDFVGGSFCAFDKVDVDVWSVGGVEVFELDVGFATDADELGSAFGFVGLAFEHAACKNFGCFG